MPSFAHVRRSPVVRPRRRHVWDRRRPLDPVPPAPPAVTVVEVYYLDDLSLVWRFSAPVVVAPGLTCPQLEADDRVHGWRAALGLEVYDESAVVAYYPSGTMLDADSGYRVVAPPVGIAFAGGAELALPQAGDVVAPP